MSFPKANVKRFNEVAGCAPPPGTYEAKRLDKATGGVVEKCDRFRAPKDVPVSGVADCSNVSSMPLIKTPCKQLFNHSGKGGKPQTSMADNGKVKDLEKEIRRLLKERVDRDKVLSAKEEESKKLEGRLYNAQVDRSALQAKLAAADKDLKEQKKSNDLLKTKLQATETSGKRHEELQTQVVTLKQQIHTKDLEISSLRKELDVVMTTLLSNLQSFESLTKGLEDTVESYGTFVATLQIEQTPSKKNARNERKHSKSDEEEISKLKNDKTSVDHKMKIVKKSTEKLQQRFSHALSELSTVKKSLEGHYSEMSDRHTQLQAALSHVEAELHTALEVKKSLEEYRDTLQKSNTDLQKEVDNLTTEKQNTHEALRVVQENMVKLQESKEALEKQLNGVDGLHSRTHIEDADRILALEQQELEAKNEVEDLQCRLEELHMENDDLKQRISNAENVLIETREENQKIADLVQETQGKYETDKCSFLKQIEGLMFEKSKSESFLTETEEKFKELEESFKTLKQENADQVEKLMDKVRSEMMAREDVQSKVGDLEYEKAQLEMEIGHLEAKMKMISVETDQVQREATQTKDTVQVYQERLNSVLLELEQVDQREQEMAKQKSSLETKVELMNTEFDTYSQSSEQKISQLTDDVAGLTEQRDQMARDFDDWLTEKSELDIEIAKLQCRLKVVEMESNQQTEELHKSINHYMDQLDKTTAEKHQIEKDMERYGIDLLTNAAQIQSLQEQLKRKEKENETLSHELTEEKNSNTSLATDLQQQIVNYQEQLSNKGEEFKNLAEVMDEAKQEYSDLIGELQRKLKSAETDLARSTKGNKQLSKDNQTLTEDNTKLTDDNTKLTEENTQFEEDNTKLKEDHTKLTEDNTKLTKDNTKLTEDNTKLTDDNTHFEDDNTKLKEDHTKFTEDNTKLTEDNTQMTEDNTKLKEDHTKLTEDKTKLTEDNTKLTEDNTKLTEDNTKLTDDNTQFEEDIIKLTEGNTKLTEDNTKKTEDNTKLTEDNTKLKEDNTQLTQNNMQLTENSKTLTDEITSTSEGLTYAVKKVESLSKLNEEMKNKLDRKVEELLETREELSNLTDQMEDAQISLQSESKKCAELELNNQELDSELALSVSEGLSLRDHMKSLESSQRNTEKELERIRDEYDSEISSLQEKLEGGVDSEEVQSITDELEKYRTMYDDLLTKVMPFMEQIDSFELEKQALLGQSQNAQAEIDRLSQDYAKLLGHQNQKQKIRHICKIKDENNALKREVSTLREQCAKQKRKINKLEEKETGSRLDTSRAFSHSKENTNLNQTTPMPLRDVNRR